MCLYLYTISGWLFAELNKGSREGDQAKVDTLGPFAQTFGKIIGGATAMKRTDIAEMKDLLEKKGTKLYRGTGLTQEELMTYKALIGKKSKDKHDKSHLMCLTGFISTSMNRSAA